MSILRSGFVAVCVAVVLVAAGEPALTDPPAEGGLCQPSWLPNGLEGVTEGFPSSPWTNNPGMTLPELTVEPIAVNATIAPGQGETFEPITLTHVWAKPTAKVLRTSTVDPDHAVMEWKFRVNQFCPDTGQPETCDYIYHEMPNGAVFEVATLDGGQPFEHAFHILCHTVMAFRAIGAPPDLGVRLLAAAKAQAPPAQIEVNATNALGQHVVAAAGVPGLALPPDIAAWAGVVVATIGLASLATGPCGGYFTAIAGSEIGVWTQLLTIPTAPPEAKTPKAVTAVIAKTASTVAYVQLIPACMALMVGAGGTLTALLDLVMALGSIFWWTSTLGLIIYGLDFAINHWL